MASNLIFCFISPKIYIFCKRFVQQRRKPLVTFCVFLSKLTAIFLNQAAMKFCNNFSLYVKLNLSRPRCLILRYFKALPSVRKIVSILLCLLVIVLLTRYRHVIFDLLPPHYFLSPKSFWGHLEEGEEIREIVCSRFSKGCYAILDSTFEKNTVVRYLISEKTEGYLTQSVVKKDENGKEMIMKGEDVLAHIRGMILGCFLTGSLGKSNRLASVLIVGLGGGAMNNYLSTLEQQPMVTIVEIDPTIYYIARQWFDSKPTRFQEFFVEDGIKFIENRANIFIKTVDVALLYDAILIDCSAIESTNDLMAPIPQFMDLKVLENVKRILKPGGTVVVNVASLNVQWGDEILTKPHDVYTQLFKTCFFLKASFNFAMVCTDKTVNASTYSGYKELVQSLPTHIQEGLTKDILYQPYFENDNTSSY